MKNVVPSMYAPEVEERKLDIAIVGGGIIGLILALGLDRRGINVKVYEQARSHREIGAGVAFTENAINCMGQIDPRLVAALRSVATSNGDPRHPNDHLQWVDGFNVDPAQPDVEKLLFKLYAGPRGFEGCHRAHFLDALLKVVPEGVVHFRKRLSRVIDEEDQEKVQLEFEDGTVAEADAVIGCDGIKSRVRELMFGSDNPVSHPTYTHKIAYRGLIPMDKAVEAIGENKAKNQHMHLGPRAHLVHFPVANQTLMNVVAFAPDPEDWEGSKAFVAPATRQEVEKIFAGWGTTVRSIASLLPDELDKWAVFDQATFPVPCYNKSRICIAGDAAHAAAPHHGAGAGVGVEDALCLSSILEKADSLINDNKTSKFEALKLAFHTFNTIRRKRTQWLVQSSHDVCEIYEWNDPKTGSDAEKCFAEIKRRSHKIWNFDYKDMVRESCESFEWRVVIQALVSGDRKVDLPALEQMIEGEDSETDSMSVSDSSESIATPVELAMPVLPFKGLLLDAGIKIPALEALAIEQEGQIVQAVEAA